MVQQPIIKPIAFKVWRQWKTMTPMQLHKVLMTLNKTAGAMLSKKFTEADVAKSWKDLKVLYLKFDQNLVKAIQKTNSARDDTDAVIALRELLRICDQYIATITKFQDKSEAHDFVGIGMIKSLNDHIREPAKDALDRLPTDKSVT